MEKKHAYAAFPNFCLRTPLFPLSFYLNLIRPWQISEEHFLALLDNKVLCEAVYLASPELESQLQKWKDGSITDPKKVGRLKSSLLKYVSRISSRCTPFGLFASCAAGQMADETQIEFSNTEPHSRATRFDMSFLSQLQFELLKNREIRNQLTFFPNTSLYRIGDHFRYIEYTFQNKRRSYALEGIDATEYIAQILQDSTEGKTIQDLAESLLDEDIDLEEATDFIYQLIDNQILVSELELTVTGDDYFEKLLKRLQEINADDSLLWLNELQEQLKKIDATIGNTSTDYKQIIDLAKGKFSDFNTKYLLQTDSFSNLKHNTLKQSILAQLQEAIQLFSKISVLSSDEKLETFKQTFRKRYDDAEVPLTTILDSEIGISLGERQYDNSDFLNDVPVESSNPSHQQVLWSRFDYTMQKKLFEAFQKNLDIIEITDKDFESLPDDWNAPDTFSTMIEVIPNEEGEDHIFVNSFGGSSGAYLLGRFTHGDKKLFDHVQEMLAYEQAAHPDKLVAEIVHLPEARTGNILQRSNTRDYEIVYLGNSALEQSQQISIDDIMISVQRNKIILRSKKWNREIVPKLTNAHNFSMDPLPIYEFLCHLQNFENPTSIGFYWNSTFLQLPFLPRVVYKNLILSKARWLISVTEFKKVMEVEISIESIEKWRAEHHIPQWANLAEGDNKLLINFKNKDSIDMLYESVKKRTSFMLEEFLFAETSHSEEDDFRCNQYVISFYKQSQES
jgi:hypothetical protein